MAFEVLKHGALEDSYAPQTGKPTRGRKVTFLEKGRGGAKQTLVDSTNYLNSLTGKQTGLELFRTHTQFIREEELGDFPVGKKFQGFINRKMTSLPEMGQQENVLPQRIDGRPTYFQTYLWGTMEEDIDLRMTNEQLIQLKPELILNAITSRARVDIIDEQPTPVLAEVEEPADLTK